MIDEVLGVRCEPGAKAKGRPVIGELRSGTPVTLPVRIVRGAVEGPVLTLTGVIHGDEPNGLAAINRLCDELDPRELTGTVIGLPMCNPFAFITRSRISSLDYERLNLNRVFPGNDRGLIGERMAGAIFEGAIKRSDCLIDFHEGGYDFIARYLIAPDPGDDDEMAAANLRLARAFGRGVPINVVRLTPQHLMVGRVGSSTTQANVAGIPAICNELGGAGAVWPEHVEDAVRGTRNVMRHLDMLPGEPEAGPTQLVGTDSWWPRPSRGGWWRQVVELGQVVEEGELLGHVRNLFGEVAEEVRAPFRSVIFDVRNSATIMTGEWTVHCGRLVG